jgi:hypothetical protein
LQAFYDVMEMVAKGVTPPNVRTDIDDSPPDPTKPLPEPRMPARPKPWETRAAAAAAAGRPAGGAFPGADPAGAAGPHHSARLDPGAPEWVPPAGPSPSAGAAHSGVAYDSLDPAAAGGTPQLGAGRLAAPQAPQAPQAYAPPKVSSWRPPPPPMPTISSAAGSSASGSPTAGAGSPPQAAAAPAAPPPASAEITAEA